LENDHKLTASQRGRLWTTTMFHIWAYGQGVGGAWSTTTSVLGVKKLHLHVCIVVLCGFHQACSRYIWPSRTASRCLRRPDISFLFSASQ